ncbi:MAG TPA: hypothetical protein PKM60_11325 [Zoogloea sp.]|uniref:hypothetical protein n=1 Tax=Zoogloea sp. TaxID=49181 RepID=UPI002C309DD0|nr:hypothetical protein [Zoogloea sp.]HOB46757.1 hypothetical protein [Zoogloea sp.]HQA10917.1 hypothetical protein [Zoogloea sp.]HQE40363.1 hypothetical protein [Zoogloea sp.]
MASLANSPESKRKIKETELAGRRYQKSTLELELDHFIQTHQDTAGLSEKLANLNAEIAQLEEELHKL